jgi:hypothetical protein
MRALAPAFAQPQFSPTHHLGSCHVNVLAAATRVLARHFEATTLH